MTEASAELKKVKIEVPGPDGASPEVFWGEGATESEAYNAAAQRVAEGKQHATAKIREQQQELERYQALATQAAQPAVNTDDMSTQDRDAYFNEMYSNPRKLHSKVFSEEFERIFGTAPEQAAEEFNRLRQMEQNAAMRQVADTWPTTHPEFAALPPEERFKAGQAIEAVVKEKNLPYTTDGLDLAYAYALQHGKVKINPVNADTAPPSAPATLNGNTGGDGSADEATVLKGMSLDQRRAYYSERAARFRQGQ